MMSKRTKQEQYRGAGALSSRLFCRRYGSVTLVTSLLLVGVMVVIQMTEAVSGVSAATTVSVNLSSTVIVPSCEFSLSSDRPAMRAVDASEIVTGKAVELGDVTLQLSNCSGHVFYGERIKFGFRGATLKESGGTGVRDEFLFRDADSTAQNVGFLLAWNCGTAPWQVVPTGCTQISGPDFVVDWPNDALDLIDLNGKTTRLAYSLSPGNHPPEEVAAGKVKASVTITLYVS